MPSQIYINSKTDQDEEEYSNEGRIQPRNLTSLTLCCHMGPSDNTECHAAIISIPFFRQLHQALNSGAKGLNYHCALQLYKYL